MRITYETTVTSNRVDYQGKIKSQIKYRDWSIEVDGQLELGSIVRVVVIAGPGDIAEDDRHLAEQTGTAPADRFKDIESAWGNDVNSDTDVSGHKT